MTQNSPNHLEIMNEISGLKKDLEHAQEITQDRFKRGEAIFKMLQEFKDDVSQKLEIFNGQIESIRSEFKIEIEKLTSRQDLIFKIITSKWLPIVLSILFMTILVAGGGVTLFGIIKFNWFEGLIKAKELVQ